MTTTTTAPLPVQLLDVLTRHYGEPAPGGQSAELTAAIAKLVSVAAQQRAMRQLWKHEEGFWDRLKAEMNEPQAQQQRGH
ncbi:hypothetical protein dqs_1788 [Azoarcus olearius]|uniref:hypothetical protein n=1 Tax=Azoarcus sp. (strain BH72) TaxID=418699 RepID=UPI00080617DC|nr:hypothetical protein [Azoarcus olearius]ANQ84826.1 hypothetical protein dqs_1788 [Azoarcus olearius]